MRYAAIIVLAASLSACGESQAPPPAENALLASAVSKIELYRWVDGAQGQMSGEAAQLADACREYALAKAEKTPVPVDTGEGMDTGCDPYREQLAAIVSQQSGLSVVPGAFESPQVWRKIREGRLASLFQYKQSEEKSEAASESDSDASQDQGNDDITSSFDTF